MNRRSFLKATVGASVLAAEPVVSKAGAVEIGVCAGTEDLGKAERWGFVTTWNRLPLLSRH